MRLARPYVQNEPLRPPGRPRLDDATKKRHKQLWNDKYRAAGLYKTLGIRTEDKEIIADLAQANKVSIVDMLHMLVEDYLKRN